MLAAAAFFVVLASLVIGGRETNDIALARQRETIGRALAQHGQALARELRVQTVWTEAFEKTRAHDQSWMHAFYGVFLSKLLDYDNIYVLSIDDAPVYAFVHGHDTSPAAYAAIAPKIKDLVGAVRKPGSAPGYDVVNTDLALSDGQSVHHLAVADVRNVLNAPATVVVSTIVPDRPTPDALDAKPYLLVAVENLDAQLTKRLGAGFTFGDLHWITGNTGKVPPGYSSFKLTALDGASVGTLAWRNAQPGWQFVRHVAVGLTISLLLLAALAALLMRWGRQQARQLVESEAEAQHAAKTDALTGLMNRVGLSERLPSLIAKAKGEASTLGVLSVDLDRFKEINDGFGHACGDAVLLAVSKRLKELLGPQSLVARPGNDEFMLLVAGLGRDGLTELADRIVMRLAEPIDVDGGTRVMITASVGYALAPADGDRTDDLVRRVELAVAKAKEDGGGEAVAFAPEMDLELFRRRVLENALRKAVAAGDISTLYQPIMDPTGTRVVAAEALARWSDPLLGPISPDLFIPLAEETGLIPELGKQILRRALADAMDWPGIDIAVNVSAAQIHHGDIVEVVGEELQRSGFPAHRLEIEITESVLLADEKRAQGQIHGLRNLGVRVALDDFGAGYSSLQYLHKFGFDKLKIDRGFIKSIGTPDDSSVILASIVKLGLGLRMTITGEGVESDEQFRVLRDLGCHQIQGYLFSRPLTAGQFTLFLAAHRPIAAAG
ncbi:MAG TPA: EAL domain-containing protein [Hyphomicrobium sp.]|nr:EAL domain-containing protein [Hyphomicrobium sp.]